MVTTAPTPTRTVERPARPRRAVGDAEAAAAEAVTQVREPRRLRRMAAFGPRCPDCAGPLAFGEGCSLCPVCGYSSCTPARRGP
jgi:hypothetical protein